uniref:Uncharacterized protein n=1 Tax=Meloidogyne hapla TaxID=6305 RepID=A0A1I8B7M2_MELHA
MPIIVDVERAYFLDKILREFLIKGFNEGIEGLELIFKQIDEIIKYFGQQIENIILYSSRNKKNELERNCAENILKINSEDWLLLGGTDRNEFTVKCHGDIINELNSKIEESIERLLKKIPENNQLKEEYSSIRAHYLINEMGIKLYSQLAKIIGVNNKELEELYKNDEDFNKLFEKIKSSFNLNLIKNSLFAKTIVEEIFKLMNGNGKEFENLKEIIQNSNAELPEEMIDEEKWISTLIKKELKKEEILEGEKNLEEEKSLIFITQGNIKN